MMRLATLTFGAALAALPALAQDMTPAEQAHALREAHMHLNSGNLGPLVQMVRGEAEFDAEVAATRAGNIASYAGVDLRPYFVEGSSSEELEGSRALPAAFENLDDIAAKQNDLQQAAQAAADAAGQGQEAFTAAFQAVGQACSACHEEYRLPED